MNDYRCLNIGKWLFAIALLGFGGLQLTEGRFIEIFPVAAWLPLKTVFAYLTALGFAVSGLLILTQKYALQGAYLSAALFFLTLAFINLPSLVMNITNVNDYTFPFENVMFFSGALLLCGIFLNKNGNTAKGIRVLTVGKYIFAIALFDFGMEHYFSEPGVITFIPVWIPWKTFWAYFVMCAFFASSISLFINKLAKTAMLMFALMFFLWLCLLHGPEVVSNTGSTEQWSFFFVPLGVCGIALLVACSLKDKVKKSA